MADGRAPLDGRDQSKEGKHVRLPQAGLGLEGLDDAIPPFFFLNFFKFLGHWSRWPQTSGFPKAKVRLAAEPSNCKRPIGRAERRRTKGQGV